MTPLHWGSPWSLLGLLVALPLIALFLLRVQPRRAVVATAVLWETLLPQSRPRQWWSRLRDPLFLALQLAMLLLLVCALAEPQWVDPTHPPVTRVVLLDNSASMQATDVSPNRFEAARAEVDHLIKHLRANDQMAIVTTAQPATILQGLTSDRQRLQQALRSAAARDTPSRTSSALELGRELTRDASHAEQFLVTDNQGSQEALALGLEAQRVISVAQPVDNLAITRWQVRRLTTDPIAYEALIELANFSSSVQNVKVRVSLDEQLLDVIPVTLTPGEPWQRVISYASAQGGVVSAELEHVDALSTDNRAVAILAAPQTRSVVLVTPGSLYLERVLQAIPTVTLQVVAERPKTLPADAVVIYHRQSCDALPPGRSMWIELAEESRALTVGPFLDQPWIMQQKSGDPLLAHLDLHQLATPGTRQLAGPSGLTVLAATDDGTPVYSLWQQTDRSALLLNLSLEQGEFAWRVAFPLLMSQAVQWLAGEGEPLLTSVAAGDMQRLPVPVESTADQDVAFWLSPVTGPPRAILPLGGELTLGPFDQVGVWRLHRTTTSSKTPPSAARSAGPLTEVVRPIACNLVNARESDLRDQGVAMRAPQMAAGWGHPLWFYAVVAALGGLPIEWWLFQRRWIG